MYRITLALLLLFSKLTAQELHENNFMRYTTQQGLSHNTVTGIAQDSAGYLWVATASGLNRYNGNQFVQYHSSNDSNSLPTEAITALVWLDRRRLAVAGHGLHILDTYTGQSKNVFIPYYNKQYQYKFNHVISATTSQAGELFIITRSGFYHFDKEYKLLFRYDHFKDDKVATSTFGFGREIFWLDDQQLIIAAADGIFLYNTGKKHFSAMRPGDWPVFAEFLDYPDKLYKFFQPKPGSLLIMKPGTDSLIYLHAHNKIKTVTQLPFNPGDLSLHYRAKLIAVSDTLFFLTSPASGFYKLSIQPGNGQVNFYPRRYFSSYFCRGILVDKDEAVWVATNKGLFRQDDARAHIQAATIPSPVELASPNIVVDAISVTGDKLFVGTRGDGGLLVYDKHTLQFEKQVAIGKGQEYERSIYALLQNGKNNLLVGTSGPLYTMDLKTFSVNKITPRDWEPNADWISAIFKDSRGNLWVASSNLYRKNAGADSFEVITNSQKLFNRIHMTMHVAEDRSGNIWVAGHGLCRYNMATQTFDKLIDSFPYIKMPDKQVNTMLADAQDNLWIAVYNNGLARYSMKEKSFRHFTRDNGLPDNNIAALYITGNKLWVAGYSGIACIDLASYKITSFGKEDGFPDLPIVQGANFFYDSMQRRLYLGFSNAIVRFNPDSMLMNGPVPRLFIESITAGEGPVNYLPKESFATSYKHNDLTVTIGSINFFNNSTQRFAYREVKNGADSWHSLGARNTFTISGLSPGTHRIQVKMFSSENKWPAQVKDILITIQPPFWKQTWFLIIIAILALSGVYALVGWQTGVARKQEQQKTHIHELKAAEYKNKFELEQISNYFSSSMAGKKQVDEVLWDLTRNLIARLNYQDCMIYLWNEDKTKMVQKAAYGPKGSPEALRDHVFDVMPGQGVVGYVMQTREPLLIPDTRQEPRYRQDEMVRLSEICVPIIHNNELIGIIDSEHSDLNYYKESDMKILTTIATLVGNKIRQIESEQSLQVKQAEIASINQQLAEAQLSALQTQMNPHFIFNALNSIKRMILDNQQQKASRYLSKFAQMIRLTLDQSKEIFATLQENIEYLESYLEMERLRFDESFTFHITVDEGVDEEEATIPTLMIQPLVENAIWHGLLHKEGEKKLNIGFTRQSDTLVCMIEDNGIGIRQSKKMKQGKKNAHRSVGLENLHNRIMIMNEKYGTGCRLDITDMKDIDENGSGTLAVLRFNIVNNKTLYESTVG
jgi:ligand-binding sensor domain-containing protein/putative methionine-R-sulfoxide reductase with GAF domain